MSVPRWYLNLFLTFLVSGLWHGANWTFVVWGLYHGIFLIIERTPFGDLTRKIWSPVQHILTFVIILIGWVLFRSDTIGDALSFIGVMFGAGTAIGYETLVMYIDNKLALEISFALICSLPILPKVSKCIDRFTSANRGKTGILIGASYEMVQICLISTLTYYTVISLAAGVYNPFIYFRF